jgi:hypothetical protein
VRLRAHVVVVVYNDLLLRRRGPVLGGRRIASGLEMRLGVTDGMEIGGRLVVCVMLRRRRCSWSTLERHVRGSLMDEVMRRGRVAIPEVVIWRRSWRPGNTMMILLRLWLGLAVTNAAW